MRAAVLAVFVGVLCLVALFRPKIGLYGYVWFALMRPDVLAWQPNSGYSFWLAVSLLLGSIRYVNSVRILATNGICRFILLLHIPIVLSVLTAVKPELCYEPLWLHIRVMVPILLIPILIRTEKDLAWLVLVVAMSLGLVGLRFGLYGLRMGGVRYGQGYGGFLSDNNDLGLALVMVLPLCWYARNLSSSILVRTTLLAIALGTLSAIVMTHSRGAAISLAAVLAVLLGASKQRVRTLIILLILLLPGAYLVRQTYLDRLTTLRSPQTEASATSRLSLAKAAIRLWMDYPLFGVGFGQSNQQALTQRYAQGSTEAWTDQVVHNTYLQMLTDSGLFAFALYTSLLWGLLFWLGKNARLIATLQPGMEVYPRMFQASLLAFAVGSTFLSRVTFDLIWLLFLMCAAWHEIQKQLTSTISLNAHERPEP